MKIMINTSISDEQINTIKDVSDNMEMLIAKSRDEQIAHITHPLRLQTRDAGEVVRRRLRRELVVVRGVRRALELDRDVRVLLVDHAREVVPDVDLRLRVRGHLPPERHLAAASLRGRGAAGAARQRKGCQSGCAHDHDSLFDLH